MGLGRHARLAFALLALSWVSPASAAKPRPPFGSDHGLVRAPLDLQREVSKLKKSRDTRPLLRQIRRDPHFLAMEQRLDFARHLEDAAQGRFDRGRFFKEARGAVRHYVKTHTALTQDAFKREHNKDVEGVLSRQLESLAFALEGGQAATRSQAPRPSRATARIYGARRSYPAAMQPVKSAEVLVGAKDALARYGWMLDGTRKASTHHGAALARVGVGRAVFFDDVFLDVDTGAQRPARGKIGAREIRTQALVKGVGPTRYAGGKNRFSKRKSGSFPLSQAERDMELTAVLKKGGVPVYAVEATIALPYWDMHPKQGWRPLAIYARLPHENLRISALADVPKAQRLAVIEGLRDKIAVLARAERATLSRADTLRFAVVRLGRAAGLMEGGKTFPGGKSFFHGMLHAQNVSLLGELVDFSECPGLIPKSALTNVYRESGYTNAQRGWPPSFAQEKREVVVFRTVLMENLRRLITEALPKAERPTKEAIDALFERSYAEGLAGKRADDAAAVLRAAQRPATP